MTQDYEGPDMRSNVEAILGTPIDFADREVIPAGPPPPPPDPEDDYDVENRAPDKKGKRDRPKTATRRRKA